MLVSVALLLADSGRAQQQQYDSLGSPTPAPNQAASPNTVNLGRPAWR